MSLPAIVPQLFPSEAPAPQPQPASFIPHDRVRAVSKDTFDGLLGTVLSVHATDSRRPFAFVALDDKRWANDKLYFALDELEGSAERKVVQPLTTTCTTS